MEERYISRILTFYVVSFMMAVERESKALELRKHSRVALHPHAFLITNWVVKEKVFGGSDTKLNLKINRIYCIFGL